MHSKKTVLYLSLFCTTQIYSVSANATLIKQDLGTLKGDNSDVSSARAVSDDGWVIVGEARNDNRDRQAFRHNKGDSKMTSLGTLKSDNSGNSFANAVSASGRVVVGYADNDNDAIFTQAFRHDEGDIKMTGLGTLKTDNSGYSSANAVSANGWVVVGEADNDKGFKQAFRHDKGDTKMTGLGTLKIDNSGNSFANAVSANGRVVVGQAQNDSHKLQAFRHNKGDIKMTALGTLKSDNSGLSSANAVSADGRVVVGSASNDNDQFNTQAFRHNEGDSKMTGLGTLRTNNLGYSVARAVSGDGRVVVGNADNDKNDNQAFRHNEGDIKMTALGTLRTDNSGYSSALAVSANGRVVVGYAQNENGSKQAFRHNEGDSKMTALGTLKSDNSGTSSALAVSADGRIVVGEAHNNLGQSRAVIWKTAKAVDVDYTIDSMIKSTDKAQQVLGVYEGQLFSLADQNCHLDANKDYCLGIYTNYNNVKSSDLYASGLIGALRIANTGWTVGGAVNFNLSNDLVDGYDVHGFDLPGVGVFIRYNENKDGTGFNSELKGSYLKQKMTITREALDGAEHGEGETKLSGYLVDLGFGYGIQANKWLVTPKINLRHHQITRDGYAENRHADFLASYEEMGNQNTDLVLSIKSKYALSPKVNLEAEVGSYMTLKNDQKDAVVKIDYIGEYSARKSYEQADFRPFVKLSSSYAVTPNSSVGVNVSWHKTTYSQDFTQAGFVYSYHW